MLLQLFIFDSIINTFPEMIEQAQDGNDTLFKQLNDEWETLAPTTFLYERDTSHSKEISQKLKQYYLHDEPATVNNSDGLAHVISIYISF